jgi:uncharacterized membrane protein YuzA (DUF378 family)
MLSCVLIVVGALNWGLVGLGTLDEARKTLCVVA